MTPPAVRPPAAHQRLQLANRVLARGVESSDGLCLCGSRAAPGPKSALAPARRATSRNCRRFMARSIGRARVHGCTGARVQRRCARLHGCKQGAAAGSHRACTPWRTTPASGASRRTASSVAHGAARCPARGRARAVFTCAFWPFWGAGALTRFGIDVDVRAVADGLEDPMTRRLTLTRHDDVRAGLLRCCRRDRCLGLGVRPSARAGAVDAGSRSWRPGGGRRGRAVAVNCGPGQQALIRPSLVNGQAISQVDCVARRRRRRPRPYAVTGARRQPARRRSRTSGDIETVRVGRRPRSIARRRGPCPYRTADYAPERRVVRPEPQPGRRARSSSDRRPASAPASAPPWAARRAR